MGYFNLEKPQTYDFDDSFAHVLSTGKKYRKKIRIKKMIRVGYSFEDDDEEFEQQLPLECVLRSRTIDDMLEDLDDLNDVDYVYMGMLPNTLAFQEAIDLIFELLCCEFSDGKPVNCDLNLDDIPLETVAVLLYLIDWLDIQNVYPTPTQESWIFGEVLKGFDLDSIFTYMEDNKLSAPTLITAFVWETIAEGDPYAFINTVKVLKYGNIQNLPIEWEFYPNPEVYVRFGTTSANPEPGLFPVEDRVWVGLMAHNPNHPRVKKIPWNTRLAQFTPDLDNLEWVVQNGLTPDVIRMVEANRPSQEDLQKYLAVSISNGFEDVAEYLLSVDPDLDPGIAYNDVYPIITAIGSGHFGVTERYLPKFPINTRDRNGISPLAAAAQRDDLGILNLVLNQGSNKKGRNKQRPDVNILDNNNFTPLMWAVAQHRTDNVKSLLRVPGVNVKYVNPNGLSAVSLAEQQGYDDILRLLG